LAFWKVMLCTALYVLKNNRLYIINQATTVSALDPFSWSI
jgi:hypothetical protein